MAAPLHFPLPPSPPPPPPPRRFSPSHSRSFSPSPLYSHPSFSVFLLPLLRLFFFAGTGIAAVTPRRDVTGILRYIRRRAYITWSRSQLRTPLFLRHVHHPATWPSVSSTSGLRTPRNIFTGNLRFPDDELMTCDNCNSHYSAAIIASSHRMSSFLFSENLTISRVCLYSMFTICTFSEGREKAWSRKFGNKWASSFIWRTLCIYIFRLLLDF